MAVMLGRFSGISLLLAGLAAVIAPDFVSGQEAVYAPLRGRWQVIDLVDDGRVIPQAAIPTWIPSGGQLEVIDNSIVFTSPADGQRHARTFAVDATRYPSEINFLADGRLYGHGIYKLDDGRWVICAAPVNKSARPTDFSAPAGSGRVLLVLKRPADAAPPVGGSTVAVAPPAAVGTPNAPVPAVGTPNAPVPTVDLGHLPPPPDLRSPAPGTTGKPLTDAEVLRMVVGTWKYNDAYGNFFLTLDNNGTFNTFRETATTSAFQQVFVRAPVSSGTWTLNNGQLTFRCTTSVQSDRVNQQVPYAVRSISESELIFVDGRGLIVKGVRVR